MKTEDRRIIPKGGSSTAPPKSRDVFIGSLEICLLINGAQHRRQVVTSWDDKERVAKQMAEEMGGKFLSFIFTPLMDPTPRQHPGRVHVNCRCTDMREAYKTMMMDKDIQEAVAHSAKLREQEANDLAGAIWKGIQIAGEVKVCLVPGCGKRLVDLHIPGGENQSTLTCEAGHKIALSDEILQGKPGRITGVTVTSAKFNQPATHVVTSVRLQDGEVHVECEDLDSGEAPASVQADADVRPDHVVG